MSLKNPGSGVLEEGKWSSARSWTPVGDPPQGLAGRELIGVCHKVAKRFRGMINRKALIQQYLAHSLQAWKGSSGEPAKHFGGSTLHFSGILCCSASGRIPLPGLGRGGWTALTLLLFLAPATVGCWSEICWGCSETRLQVPDLNPAGRVSWQEEGAHLWLSSLACPT